MTFIGSGARRHFVSITPLFAAAESLELAKRAENCGIDATNVAVQLKNDAARLPCEEALGTDSRELTLEPRASCARYLW